MAKSPFRTLAPQSPINPAADAYAATALALSELAAGRVRHHFDIAYGPEDAQRLDLYLPDGAPKALLPVYINIHGGGWTHGYKEWLGLNAPPVVALPAIYVSIEYRLAGVVKFPAQLEDSLLATAWVHKNIARFGGDPGKVFIGGHSAGAHLAALVTLRRDLYAANGLPQGVIKGCFAYSGLYDLRRLTVYGGNGSTGPGDKLLAAPSDEASSSPLLWVKGNTVPFFVGWGEKDSPVIMAEGPAFALALIAEGGRVETRMFPGFDHFWMHIDQQRPANYLNRTLAAWMGGDPTTAPMPAA